MVFGKVPEPGRTKTRLAPVLGPEDAARLYAAFLDDTLERCRGLGAELELWVPRHPDAEEELGRRHPDVDLRWQPGGDLGGRLRAAFSASFDEGAARALAVGSDHPTLPAEHLREALAALDAAEASLGPVPDGGYWAVGLRRDAWPRAAGLFRGIPWSTPEVLEATLRRAGELSLGVERVSPWYDVDEPADLERLRGDVRAGSATARVLEELELDGVERPDGADGP